MKSVVMMHRDMINNKPGIWYILVSFSFMLLLIFLDFLRYFKCQTSHFEKKHLLLLLRFWQR